MPFEHLRERLLKGGIAPRHVRRYLRELADHLDDLAAAEREAGQSKEEALRISRDRLGNEDHLAEAMLARPDLKSWAARAPWLLFGLAPPVAILAAFFALGIPLVLTAKLESIMGSGAFAVSRQPTAQISISDGGDQSAESEKCRFGPDAPDNNCAPEKAREATEASVLNWTEFGSC